MFTTVISVQELQALQASGQPHRVFDCSFDLTQPLAGGQQFNERRIAGALRADPNEHLSTEKTDPDAASGGRHPLPSREAFARWLDSIGFRNDMQAVVYDRQGSAFCGRLWWMLKWVGHEAVAVLDGGLQAWQAAQGAVEEGPAASPSVSVAGAFVLKPEAARLVQTPTVMSQLGRPGFNLLDARAPQRYRGEVEPLDPVAGHIPGALNRPFTLNFSADGRFKPAAELRAEFETLLAGRDPTTVVHQCGSGVTATPNLIAMEIAGLGRAALYAGSWSEWCSDPSRPVAQG
jgi:thiosulfate/3-mercaptopyruvate sulfurtransferase